ncbi:MAG: hypothetical protein IPJ37_16440 [Bacteroidales bacterium]|nr:hypothetical protein [Bacteroidales bacterium]
MKTLLIFMLLILLAGCTTPGRLGMSYKGKKINNVVAIDKKLSSNTELTVNFLTKEDRRIEIPDLNVIFSNYVFRNSALSNLAKSNPGTKFELTVNPSEQIKKSWILDILFLSRVGCLLPYTPWWGNVNLDGNLKISVPDQKTLTYDFKASVPFKINSYPYYVAGKKLTIKYAEAYSKMFDEISHFEFQNLPEFSDLSNNNRSITSDYISNTGINSADISTHSDMLPSDLPRFGICNFTLWAGTNTSAIFGIAGAISDAARNEADRPYYQQLSNDMLDRVEKTILNSRKIIYFRNHDLIEAASEDSTQILPVIKRNDLDVCIVANSGLGIKMGWSKKVNMGTTWTVIDIHGNRNIISTTAISNESQGVFPNEADPNLKEVWLDLAEENTLQFLEKYYALINTIPGNETNVAFNAKMNRENRSKAWISMKRKRN